MLYVVFGVAVTVTVLVWLKTREPSPPIDWHRVRGWMDGE
jgi:hypothetical protein